MSNSYDKVATASERIKKALNLRGMKQVELSEKSGINKPSISCYVSGKYEPKPSTLYELGKVLDVSEMWLAGYDVPMERPLEQKENDEFVDLVDKLQNEKKFRQLVLKLANLNEEKLEGLMKLMDISLD